MILVFILFMPFIISATEYVPEKVKKRNVPEVVVENMQKKFPAVKRIKWKKAGSLYIAVFRIENKKTEATFMQGGGHLGISTEYKLKELPDKLLLSWLQGFYIDWSTEKISRIEMSGELPVFHFRVSKYDMVREIVYNEKGDLLNEILLE
jgi:hypothetical protein